MQPVSKSRHYVSNLQLYVLIFCLNVTLTPFGIFRNHKSIQIKSLNIVKINKSVVMCLEGLLRPLIPFRNSVTRLRSWADFSVSNGDSTVLLLPEMKLWDSALLSLMSCLVNCMPFFLPTHLSCVVFFEHEQFCTSQ